MEVAVPRWSSWSFLVYAGGFVVLGSALGWLAYLSANYGDAAYTGWALAVLVVLQGVARGFLRRSHRVTSGVFAFVGVFAFAAFVAALFTWFGWLGHVGTSSSFKGFNTARLALELLTLAAAGASLRTFRYPLLMLPVVVLAWVLVTDLLSGGGDWSAILTFFIGLVFLGSAVGADAGPRKPYGFWLHLAAGLAIGGSLLHFWHSGTFDWVLVILASLVYIRFAGAFARASWAVLGTIGLLFASVHFTIEWTTITLPLIGAQGHSSRGWVPPLVFAVTGVLLVALGQALARRAPAAT